MLGTSTASGNFSDEGKTCVIFTSALISSRYFPQRRKLCWQKYRARAKVVIFPVD